MGPQVRCPFSPSPSPGLEAAVNLSPTSFAMVTVEPVPGFHPTVSPVPGQRRVSSARKWGGGGPCWPHLLVFTPS